MTADRIDVGAGAVSIAQRAGLITLSDRATAILDVLGDEQIESQPNPDSPTALLQASRDQHTLYRRNLRHSVNGVIVPGNPEAAAVALREAARKRARAELADPTHADEAWVNDLAQKYPHAALLEWYQEILNGA